MTITIEINGIEKEIVSVQPCPTCGFPMEETVTDYGYHHECLICDYEEEEDWRD